MINNNTGPHAWFCCKRRVLVTLFCGLLGGIAIGYLFAQFELNYGFDKEIGSISHDTYKYPEITIDIEGNLFHNGQPIAESELIEIVRVEFQKQITTEGDGLEQDGIIPMYGTIMLNVHEELPFKDYIAISRLILRHGGYTAISSYTSHQSDTGVSPKAPMKTGKE